MPSSASPSLQLRLVSSLWCFPQCVWALSSAISLAVLYFDYALTFGMEVERFWKREFSTASFGFFLNRYLAVFAHIPIIYEFFGPQTPSVRMLL